MTVHLFPSVNNIYFLHFASYLRRKNVLKKHSSACKYTFSKICIYIQLYIFHLSWFFRTGFQFFKLKSIPFYFPRRVIYLRKKRLLLVKMKILVSNDFIKILNEFVEQALFKLFRFHSRLFFCYFNGWSSVELYIVNMATPLVEWCKKEKIPTPLGRFLNLRY